VRNKPARISVLCAIGIVCLAAGAAAYVQAPPTPAVHDPSAAKEFLLQGIAKRAAALKSAVFSAHGQKKGAGRDEKEDKEQIANGDIFLHGAIDEGRLRFDYSEPMWHLAPEKARIRTQTCFIKTPTRTANWYKPSPNIFVGPPNREMAEFIRRFDINALGLYGWLAFERSKGLNEVLDTYRSNKRFEVKDAGKGLFTLTFLFDDALTSNRWAMDIDTLHGFTPVRFRLTEYNKPLRATAVTQSSDVTWKQINGAWVPETFKIWLGEGAGAPNPRPFKSVELTFTFQQVNQPVDDAEFNYKSFPAPASTGVIDVPVLRRPRTRRKETLGSRTGP
jgi:hypothetical protein